MQGEVIRSLQMAVQHEAAILNLTMLHEASLANRRATFVTLDQLKQRLLPRMPIIRKLHGGLESPTSRLSPTTIHSFGPSTFHAENYIPDNYVPPAVTLPYRQDMRHSGHGLADYFRERERDHSFPEQACVQSRDSKAPEDINFSQALHHLMKTRGTENRAVIMQEIDEIMDSYQGLHISQRPNDSGNDSQYGYNNGERRDTMTMPSESQSYPHAPLVSTRAAMHVSRNLPPSHQEYGGGNHLQHPVPNSGIFSQQHEHPNYPQQQYPTKNSYPQMAAQSPGPRRSTNSSNSAYSDSSSLNRNSSTSSQGSHAQNPPLPLKHSPRNTSPSMSHQPVSPDIKTRHEDNRHMAQPSHSAPYAAPREHCSQPIAPLVPQYPRQLSNGSPHPAPQSHSPANATATSYQDHNSLMYTPYAAPYQYASSSDIAPFAHPQPQQYHVADQTVTASSTDRPIYHLSPQVARDTSSTHSTTSDRTVIQPNVTPTSPINAHSTRPRHSSIAPSIASTVSSNSIPMGILPSTSASLRTSTMQSDPANHERMMSGRPCKANSYWGFCKGAWTIREDAKKGLTLRTQPSGMYNSREIWECTSCTFKGATCAAPHPSKKGKSVMLYDQRVMQSRSRVRYKWLFLAKSHVKKRAVDSHSEESSYGCVFCSLEDRVSSVYGGVETLMDHIALCHVADMSESTRWKARCVVGRVPGEGEDWDIHIPVFDRVEELP
jgi:hypothetical protein